MTVASLSSQGTQVEGSDVYVMQFMLNSITANGTMHTYIPSADTTLSLWECQALILSQRQQFICEMWGSHRTATEDSGFRGSDALVFGKQLPTYRRIVLASASTKIGSRRLGLFDSESQWITICRNVGKWSADGTPSVPKDLTPCLFNYVFSSSDYKP
jgi:hypothetical protein